MPLVAEQPRQDRLASSPRPLRVAWVAGQQTLDRFARVLRPLAIGMLDELVQLTAICPERADASSMPTPPVAVMPYATPRWWNRWTSLAHPLVEKLPADKLQLLHALDAGSAKLAAALAKRLGLPYIVSCHSLRDARRLDRRDHNVAAVVAASEPILAQLQRRKVARDDKLHLLRPGVHRVRHANCFNDPQRSISIVLCGALDDFDAYAAALRSLAELTAREYDCAFFIIGDGPAERRLRSLAERLAMHHQLTFAGPRPGPQLPGILKAADIYVSPVSRTDLDLHCLLAMAAGVPVLAPSGGAADFLRDGETATLFPRANATALTEKLVALLDDRPAARDLAESGLRYIRDHHSPAAMVFALAEIYRGIVQPPAEAP